MCGAGTAEQGVKDIFWHILSHSGIFPMFLDFMAIYIINYQPFKKKQQKVRFSSELLNFLKSVAFRRLPGFAHLYLC
jgi:hypothetical protein